MKGEKRNTSNKVNQSFRNCLGFKYLFLINLVHPPQPFAVLARLCHNLTTTMTNFKSRLLDLYERNETKVDVAFFLGGFVFDVFTLSDIDDPLNILQQVVYLLIIGSILFYDFLGSQDLFKPSPRIQKLWNYRQLIVHFLLGSLLSVYSLFFFKSASIFSSIIFIALMAGLMIANELKNVQKSEVNLKIALFVICVFSFFSMLIPVLLGFVGIVPFTLSVIATGLVLGGIVKLLKKKIQDSRLLLKSIAAPGGIVLVLFFLFYLVGWIPPVPLSVQTMGIYHSIEKSEGQYLLSHERPGWKFWHKGDQDFYAEPGDKINFFAEIFSPARFDESVILKTTA